MNSLQMMQNFQRFKKEMEAKNPVINPQEKVSQMLQNGEVSQQDFEKARQMAAMLASKCEVRL